ncbi:MAG TPA: hypothetical protein VKQ36_16440 [Ktedonobacterales bacterium]|nr:hypothetical protein [Ktedonobacterales bacterium]
MITSAVQPWQAALPRLDHYHGSVGPAMGALCCTAALLGGRSLPHDEVCQRGRRRNTV